MRLLTFTVIAFYSFGAAAVEGTVTAVGDGDTFALGGTTVHVFGIDAPEFAQQCRADAIHAPGPSPCVPCGQRARDVLAGLVLGKTVTCTDRGECTAGKTLVGPFMLTQGQAVADRAVLDVKDKALYIGAEASGKRANAGIWAQTFIPPQAWRERKQRLECER